MPNLRLRACDIALAAAAAAALLIEGQWRAKGGLSPGAYVLAVAAAAPLVWRTRAPLATLARVAVGALACAVAFHASWAGTGIVIAALYRVALVGDRQRSLIVGTLTAIGVIVTILLIDGSVDLQGVAMRVLAVFLSLALGDTIRSRQALRAAARERAERDAREREEEHRRRIADERLQIARELHDALAHTLVAINVQAGVAAALDRAQDSSAALHDIKDASALALRDLRGTLSLLRERSDAAPTAPAFDLDALPSLVDHARSAGLRADVDAQVNGTAVPSAVGVAAYRIVQAAFSNALRHAHASRAHVRIQVVPGALDVEITYDGQVDAAAANGATGLRGMAERAEALGGRLEVRPRAEGGWRVHAVFPLGSDRR